MSRKPTPAPAENRIVATRKALSGALSAITRIVEARSTTPILANVLLHAQGQVLTLRGTDLDLEVEHEITLEEPATGEFTLEAARLQKIVAGFGESAVVAIEWDSARAVIQSGRSRFTLPVMPASDFPALDIAPASHAFTLPGAKLERLFGKARFSVSEGQARYYLEGVYLHSDGEHMKAAATSGHTLAEVVDALPDGAGGMPGIIVPTKTVDQIKLFGGKEDVRIEVSASKITARCADRRLTSKLIDGTFPDYLRVIPTRNDKRVTLDIAETAAAVKRVTIVQDAASKDSNASRAMAIELKDGEARLTARGSGREATETVSADFNCEGIRFSVSSDYFAQALATFDGDTVAMHLADPGSPILFTAETEPGLRVVVMPMRA